MPPTGLSHKGEAVEEWVDLHFFRPLGMRVVRLLAPTRISADLRDKVIKGPGIAISKNTNPGSAGLSACDQ